MLKMTLQMKNAQELHAGCVEGDENTQETYETPVSIIIQPGKLLQIMKFNWNSAIQALTINS